MTRPDLLRAYLTRTAQRHSDLARALGVTRSAVTQWARGTRPMPTWAARVVALLDAGRLTTGDLASVQIPE